MRDLSHFKIFRPSMFPNEVQASLGYGVREITNLCRIFKLFECEELLNEWTTLVESIIESKDLCIFKNEKTETFAFWSHFLNEDGIKWTEKTKQLIRYVLVLPIGSADAERGFSIMNHIKYNRRSRLSPQHLEDSLRIRINTEDDLEKFPAKKYALQWLKENHLRTDDPKYFHERNLNSDSKKYLPKLSFL